MENRQKPTMRLQGFPKLLAAWQAMRKASSRQARFNPELNYPLEIARLSKTAKLAIWEQAMWSPNSVQVAVSFVALCTYLMAKTTAKKLNQYFEEWLGMPVESDQEIVRLVERGLPLKSIGCLIEGGLSKDEVFAVVVNPRTLKHRRTKNQPLSKEESERAVRAARILSRAQSVMGDKQSALEWLRKPKKRFEGRSPLAMISTEPGGRLVEEMLIQIDEGMFA